MIKIKNLYKAYNETTIFKNFNIEIAEKEIVAITGSSGAGKSTLLNIIGGLEKADSGEIYINDKLIDWNNSKERREMFKSVFCYLFQNYGLIDNMTVNENLDIALKYTKSTTSKLDRKMEILKKVGIGDLLNTKVFKLSGGEQQRVALAKIFLKDSKIILADEPTASVDKDNATKIFNLLSLLRDVENKTIIIVTHDKYIASLCDRTISIDNIES
ncbi:ATP-binding cassette domain-containing protein [uncultured Clostridium sp.]|uniref:ATP-binding cassette domain-containing protein n=1 Tax=uncultured Clostridium sp. TaxID=59620 RepID=UPI002606DDEC|nr:ATP-binding cassette domain-containing protein [uncultured Clostridium sp.]